MTFQLSKPQYLITGVIIGIVVLLFVQFPLNSMFIRWTHKQAKESYLELQDMLGTPNFYDHAAGGFAIWRQPDSVFERIEIRDEALYHEKPSPHYDFLYATVKYPISRNLWSQIQYLTDSIMYDNLKQEITSRCHFMGANLATIYLAIQIAQGHKTLHEVQTSGSYKMTIMDAKRSAKTQQYLYDYIKTSKDQHPVYLIENNRYTQN